MSIYEFPPVEDPLRQGDIFIRIPRLEVSLKTLTIAGKDGKVFESSWDEVADQDEDEPTLLMVAAAVVPAIVISQDCDLLRGQDVSLCEIRPFASVEGMYKPENSDKSHMRIITQQARKNLKWFYLPADERVGFKSPMGADFRITLRLPRGDLLDYRAHRVARLNDDADEHFRERLAEFFRRFPYDEWYPLTRAEFAEYRKSYPESEPRAGQE